MTIILITVVFIPYAIALPSHLNETMVEKTRSGEEDKTVYSISHSLRFPGSKLSASMGLLYFVLTDLSICSTFTMFYGLEVIYVILTMIVIVVNPEPINKPYRDMTPEEKYITKLTKVHGGTAMVLFCLFMAQIWVIAATQLLESETPSYFFAIMISIVFLSLFATYFMYNEWENVTSLLEVLYVISVILYVGFIRRASIIF
jgi:hypothetical protein